MSQRWTRKALEKLCQHYQDEMGIFDFQPPEIATWAHKRGYELPPPLSGIERLVRMLRAAVLSARRKDQRTSIFYRALLVCSKIVKGETRRVWFDADGPAATPERVMESYRNRRDYALNILVSAAASLQRLRSQHPELLAQTDLDLGISDAEVRWRLLGPRSEESGEEKVG